MGFELRIVFVRMAFRDDVAVLARGSLPGVTALLTRVRGTSSKWLQVKRFQSKDR